MDVLQRAALAKQLRMDPPRLYPDGREIPMVRVKVVSRSDNHTVGAVDATGNSIPLSSGEGEYFIYEDWARNLSSQCDSETDREFLKRAERQYQVALAKHGNPATFAGSVEACFRKITLDEEGEARDLKPLASVEILATPEPSKKK